MNSNNPTIVAKWAEILNPYGDYIQSLIIGHLDLRNEILSSNIKDLYLIQLDGEINEFDEDIFYKKLFEEAKRKYSINFTTISYEDIYVADLLFDNKQDYQIFKLAYDKYIINSVSILQVIEELENHNLIKIIR